MDGYALLIPVLFGNALAQALFAAPGAIASRFSRRGGIITWLVTLAVLSVGVVAYLYTPTADRFDWFIAGALLVVVARQAVAYPLCRKRPILVVIAAFGIGIALAILWVVLGTLSGATPD